MLTLQLSSVFFFNIFIKHSLKVKVRRASGFLLQMEIYCSSKTLFYQPSDTVFILQIGVFCLSIVSAFSPIYVFFITPKIRWLFSVIERDYPT